MVIAHLQPIQAVLWYTPADKAQVQKFKAHLAMLQRQRVLSLQDATDICCGDDVEETRRNYLDSASLVLLFLSSDFLSSALHYEETERAMARQAAGQAHVLPVLLRACDLEGAPFPADQVLPRNCTPVNLWPDADTAFVEITTEIRKITTNLREIPDSPRKISWSNTLWRSVRGLLNAYHNHYLERIATHYDLLRLEGLSRRRAFAVRLDQVYVELRLAPNPARAARVNPLDEREFGGNRPVWDFLHGAVRRRGIGLVILGPPGSGKTTILQNITLKLAEGKRKGYQGLRRIPILMTLRNHAELINDTVKGGPPKLSVVAHAHFARELGSVPPSGWFERQLRSGTCVVLLDGLDEIAEPLQRQGAAAWIDHQIGMYPDSLFIITSRPTGYRSAPLTRADVLEVQRFNAEQAREFIRNWYVSHQILEARGQDNSSVREVAYAKANDLIDQINARPELLALTRNPLLLTMLAIVHSSSEKLPERRVDLYADICDTLLSEWQRAKKIRSPLVKAPLRDVVEPLAFHMMRMEAATLHISKLSEFLKTPIEGLGVHTEGDKEFLRELQESSGLFVEREPDQWGFAHLTFQEYLASCHLKTVGGADWLALVSDTWWHETLRLYAAQTDATALMQACLEARSPSALALAMDLLEEGIIDKTTRRAAEELLVDNMDADDPELQRSAAAAHLTRRARQLRRSESDCAVDLKLVTSGEYQLFLDDMGSHATGLIPHHWPGPRFPKGHGKRPVRGVRAHHAAAFAEWLSIREGQIGHYRLPTKSEAIANPTGSDDVAPWCAAEDGCLTLASASSFADDMLKGIRSLSTVRFPWTHPFGVERELRPSVGAELAQDILLLESRLRPYEFFKSKGGAGGADDDIALGLILLIFIWRKMLAPEIGLSRRRKMRTPEAVLPFRVAALALVMIFDNIIIMKQSANARRSHRPDEDFEKLRQLRDRSVGLVTSSETSDTLDWEGMRELGFECAAAVSTFRFLDERLKKAARECFDPLGSVSVPAPKERPTTTEHAVIFRMQDFWNASEDERRAAEERRQRDPVWLIGPASSIVLARGQVRVAVSAVRRGWIALRRLVVGLHPKAAAAVENNDLAALEKLLITISSAASAHRLESLRDAQRALASLRQRINEEHFAWCTYLESFDRHIIIKSITSPDILWAYWALRLILARQDGELPPCEGIRIVYERRHDAAPAAP